MISISQSHPPLRQVVNADFTVSSTPVAVVDTDFTVSPAPTDIDKKKRISNDIRSRNSNRILNYPYGSTSGLSRTAACLMLLYNSLIRAYGSSVDKKKRISNDIRLEIRIEF